MLRRNFLSMIPPGIMSLFAVGEHKIDVNKIETITHLYKIGDRVIYETTETEVDIRNLANITEIIAHNAVRVDCYGCPDLIKLDLPVVNYLNCNGCLKLTELELPLAITVYCMCCKSLRKIKLPNAIHVDCAGCNKLTKLEVPATTFVDCVVLPRADCRPRRINTSDLSWYSYIDSI